METPSTWRELLATIIAEPQEKQRIASELGIHQITLVRWTTGDGRPRPQLLQKLLASLPAYREQLSLLIAEEFPDFSKSINAGEAETNEIPSAFYSRVFRTIADLSPTLHFWTVCDLILRQLLEQLDPHRLGMFAILAQCMPPSSDGRVRSLREVVGRGTPPWSRELENKAMFLGAESMAGATAATGRQHYEPDLTREVGRYPVIVGDWERSAVTTPIMRHGRIAGVLLTSSTQPDYFTANRLSLLQQFADFFMIVFHPEEFYDPADINLGMMPDEEKQRPYLLTFRQRFNQRIRRTLSSASHAETEMQVWKELEEELLQIGLAPT
jgi:hypothetical protein